MHPIQWLNSFRAKASFTKALVQASADRSIESTLNILELARQARISLTGPGGDVIELASKKGTKKYLVEHRGDTLLIKKGISRFRVSLQEPFFESANLVLPDFQQRLKVSSIAQKVYKNAKKRMVKEGDYQGMVRALEAQREPLAMILTEWKEQYQKLATATEQISSGARDRLEKNAKALAPFQKNLDKLNHGIEYFKNKTK